MTYKPLYVMDVNIIYLLAKLTMAMLIKWILSVANIRLCMFFLYFAVFISLTDKQTSRKRLLYQITWLGDPR